MRSVILFFMTIAVLRVADKLAKIVKLLEGVCAK
jgi:hypothetical protein